MRRRSGLSAVCAVLALAAGACSSSGDDGRAGAVAPRVPSTTVPSTTVPSTTAPSSGPAATTRPGTGSSTTVAATSVCADPSIEVRGTITDPELDEISGIVESRRTEGLFWVHEDSGNDARLVAVGLDGAVRGAVPIEGGDVVDAEDLAAGPGPVPGTPYLFLADIGDNGIARASVTVLRLPEPEPAASTATPDRIEVRYPDGAHNAEAFVVHPSTGDWFVITKESSRASRIYRAPAPGAADRRVTLAEVGSFDVRPDLVTGADLSRDGTRLVVRTYVGIRIFTVRDGDVGAAALLCRIPYLEEAQGEAIAFIADGRLVTVSEGIDPKIHVVG